MNVVSYFQNSDFFGASVGVSKGIGTGPPRARTEVSHVDSGHWAVSGSIHPKVDPARGK